jgi:cyclic lactone autoinducer peptide
VKEEGRKQMNKQMNKIIVKIASHTVSLLSLIATFSIGGCFLWWMYEPEIPKCPKKEM